MPFKHPSKNSAFGRLNDKQQLRRSDIEDFLNAFHAQHNEQRVTEAARASVPEDTYALLEEMNTSPADAITYARDRAAKIRNQSAESRVRGESVVPPMSEREMAQLNARLRKQGIEDAKLAALPVALGAGLVTPIALGTSPLVAGLSGATLNAGINAPLNMMDERPEGIGQDTLAGAAMGLASRYHPLAAIPAGIASYAMTNVPEAEAGGWLDNLVKAASERGVRGEVLDRMVGRAKVANQYAPQLFKQHRSDLLSRHLADDSNLLTPIHGKADYDKFLQLASGSRDEGLAGWLASQHDMDRASELGQLRPWHGGPEDRMPNLGVEIYDEGLRAETHGGRHRVLNAYMNGEPTIVEINGYRDNLGPLRGDRVKVWTDDYNSELPIVGHFDTFASGGSVSGTFRRMGQRTMSQAGDVDAVTAPRGALSVIKNKGGNWLTGSVEDALSGLKRNVVPPRRTIENDLTGQAARDFEVAPRAINSFIDKQLTRYVKNEMATPEDPIRALAERGVLHVDPERLTGNYSVAERNRQLFRDDHGAGQSPGFGIGNAAQRWENTSDAVTVPNRASYYQKNQLGLSENPWLAAIASDSPVYEVTPRISSNLGFNHLIDELANALNPESGLPRHLLLDPKSMDRVSVPQAVERVAQINAWRAAQKVEADAARANNAATVLHKDYPLADYWHGGEYTPGSDITRPLYVAKNKTLAESYVDMAKDRTGKGSLVSLSHSAKSPAPENVVVEEARKLGIDVDSYTPASIFDSELHGEGVVSALVRRLKAKGYDSANLHDIGYGTQVDDVATVLFPGVKTNKGYDNPKGLRWVELKSPELNEVPEGFIPPEGMKVQNTSTGPMLVDQHTGEVWPLGRQALQDALKYEGDTMGHCVGGYCDDVAAGRSRIYSLRDAKGEPHVTIEVAPDPGALTDAYRWDNPSIKQIKGKQNRAPNAEYLPFVQDFVKSGKWSDVGDLQNTGLRRSRDIWNDLEQQKIRAAGQTFGEYVSPEEKEAIGKAVWGDAWGKYASGGPVQTKPFSISDLQAIIASLRQEHINA